MVQKLITTIYNFKVNKFDIKTNFLKILIYQYNFLSAFKEIR